MQNIYCTNISQLIVIQNVNAYGSFTQVLSHVEVACQIISAQSYQSIKYQGNEPEYN